MRDLKKLFVLLALLMLLFPSVSLSNEKRIAIYASLSEMTTLDPSTEFSNSIIVLAVTYETLLRYDPLKNEFIPVLAESWESEANGTIWRFHLRKGVKFHDGTPLTAEAVKYSIERTIKLGQGAAFIWSPVKEIKVIDDYTVEFVLSYPAPLDMIAAASYGAYIFSPNTPNTPDWFNAGNDAGSGPYKIVSWDPENEVVLERFEDWWGGWTGKEPDIVVIKIVKDAVTQEQMVLAGEISIAEYVPLDDVDILKEDPRVQVVIKPSFQNLLALLNTKKPPLNNTLVRRALAHAIPYEEIVEIARSGLARVASGPVPYGMWGHFEDLRYEYDLEKAKRLLAEAGYPEGGFKLMLVYTTGDYFEMKTAELIKASLAKLNIEVEVVPLSWEEQWSLAQSGWEDPMKAQDIFVFYWWPTYITPYDFLYNMFHNKNNTLFNLCYYENPEFEKLIDEAVLLEGYDRERSLQLYHKAQKILYEDVPAIPLWDGVDVRVGLANIEGLEEAINPAYPTVIFFQKLRLP
ncbi:MAG: ABC transporter substrate-binding protein [Thermoprotei archaeon]|nr:MAG: ABC transporter substrate-binding protein [Thermoprotei archaeon]